MLLPDNEGAALCDSSIPKEDPTIDELGRPPRTVEPNKPSVFAGELKASDKFSSGVGKPTTEELVLNGGDGIEMGLVFIEFSKCCVMEELGAPLFPSNVIGLPGRIDDVLFDSIDVPVAGFPGRMDEAVFDKIDDPDAMFGGKRGFDDVEDGSKPGGTDFGAFTKPGGGCGLADGVKCVGTKAFAVARISPSGLDS